MTTDYRTLARRWFDEVWKQGRDATIDELLTPTSVGHMEGGDTRGPADFKAVRAALLGAFSDFHVIAEDTVAEGNQVAVRWHVTVTHLGDHLGFFAPSRRAASFRGLTWLKFDGGKLVEGWDGWNPGALLQALQAAD
jgi:predicted ester cyclase